MSEIRAFILALLIGFLGSPASLVSQGLDVQFEHLSLRDGLSQATVYSIYEDDLGFIWLGTDDGLNRYDGYDFLVFRNDPLNKASLSNNSVNAIQSDAYGNIWVGTDQGLNLMRSESLKFKVHKFDFHDPGSLSSNTVWCMASDKDDHLWVGTANGLNRYDDIDSTFTKFKMEVGDENSLSNNSINTLFRSSDGSLWIGTNQGLNKWIPETERFERYSIPEDESRYGQVVQCISEDSEGQLTIGTNHGVFALQEDELVRKGYPELNDIQVNDIQADLDGDIWIGTNVGIYQYTLGKQKPVIHRFEEQNSTSLSDNNINCIIEDSTGILWIGTFSGGANIYYREQQQIFHYDHSNLGRNVFPSDLVNCVEEIAPGQFWLGTEAGIGVLNDATISANELTTVPEQLLGKSITSILKNRSQLIIGTDREGVIIYDKYTDEVKTLTRTAQGNGLSDDRISDLAFLDNRLWIGTQGSGINIYRENDSINRIQYDPSSKEGLRDNRITALCPQGNESLWIGTSSAGIQNYNVRSQKFTNYSVKADSALKISNDKILCLYYDSAVLWAGTKGGGVNKIDLLTNETTIYTTENGLANNVVYDLLPDNRGRIWMSTNKGVSVLDIENENFINYDEIDGLGNQSFLPRSGLRSSAGEIFLGGRQGLDIIRYEDIEMNTVLPKVYFTEIEAFDAKNNSYDPSLTKDIVHNLESINLSPDISLITLGFTGLNYRKPEKNTYAYRLAGLTDEWTFIGDRRYVTFSELPPGTYSLQVKAANNDGRWSEDPTELKIKIIPAFYQTNWFKALLILFFALIVFLFNQFRLKRVTKINKMLEERVKLRTSQIAKERDEKAILLKEIHHRVKNNLQIVNSLLRLQSHYVKDEEALWALDESQNRVMSMAMIHERMYKTKNLANINIPDYIRDLCTDIINTYDLSNDVKLDLDIQVEKLNLDTLTPIGLIINEISSNAMKYAFPDDMNGTFKVHLTAIEPGKRFKLIIGDDGVGMPVDLSDTEQDSLGTILMESLSEQLNGELKRLDGPGTMYQLTFDQLKDGVIE